LGPEAKSKPYQHTWSLAASNFLLFPLPPLSSHLNPSFPLSQEARQAGALREAKSKLEKQLEELTWRLQLEKRMR
ncbi:unnamed protein product, partial [Closterium sp. NIES-53]